MRNLWLRYPDLIGEALREFVLDEAILQGLRRDKVTSAVLPRTAVRRGGS